MEMRWNERIITILVDLIQIMRIERIACIRNNRIRRKAQMASYRNVDNVLYGTKEEKISSYRKDIFVRTSDDDEGKYIYNLKLI